MVNYFPAPSQEPRLEKKPEPVVVVTDPGPLPLIIEDNPATTVGPTTEPPLLVNPLLRKKLS
jgi:hypothetical protein